MDEARLASHLQELSRQNVDLGQVTCFLGAGIYDRYIPATVDAVISRGEFLTAYTPYQPEASQGYLQTIYEFQTMVADLLGCDIANASMYDGSTSLAEAAIMATGLRDPKRVAVSRAIHPHYRQVLDTYCWAAGIEVVELPMHDGVTASVDDLPPVAAILLQSPNFFGNLEAVQTFSQAAHKREALLVVSADPIACALLPPPGQQGADVVTAEGQSLGIPMGLGGPLLGLFACRQEFVRAIPGRIVGRTQEVAGERMGYVMTLRTREQDIRREKATSNICTNQALMALAATVYMAALGKNGLRSVAQSSTQNAHYAASRLSEAGFSGAFPGKFFDEFALSLPIPARTVRDRVLEDGILAGLPLGDYFPELENALLIAVTEMRTRAEIDALVDSIARASR
jgi:glycine dehydrogenase subunit 1